MRRPSILIAGLLLASAAGLGISSPVAAAPATGTHDPRHGCHRHHGDWNNRYWDDDWNDRHWNDRHWNDRHWYDRDRHCGRGHHRGHRDHGLIGQHIGPRGR